MYHFNKYFMTIKQTMKYYTECIFIRRSFNNHKHNLLATYFNSPAFRNAIAISALLVDS